MILSYLWPVLPPRNPRHPSTSTVGIAVSCYQCSCGTYKRHSGLQGTGQANFARDGVPVGQPPPRLWFACWDRKLLKRVSPLQFFYSPSCCTLSARGFWTILYIKTLVLVISLHEQSKHSHLVLDAWGAVPTLDHAPPLILKGRTGFTSLSVTSVIPFYMIQAIISSKWFKYLPAPKLQHSGSIGL